MFLVGILSWWYKGGWIDRVQIIKSRLVMSADFFSLELLFGTLFAPFRQISAGKVNGSLKDRLQAFSDRLLSRTIGAISRIIMITIGLIFITLQMLFGIITLIVWPLIPMLPVVGMIMAVLGWAP